ncbi:hypothetical protein [Paracoccus marinaquae]|uniref:Uncharacterized protein n=1 Tax=Paracoccus marinaquae TaxID=2841926 RepID=A0ABS6AJY1_9RHOB|nr:hypothetical protein [Paracoccus marinaquae]MBU3029949.1 hypothetical protein [Paracoccus marinaquae]
MKTCNFLAALLVALTPVPALAQNLSPAARAMQAAAQACMVNYGAPDSLVPALKKAGFSVSPGMDAGSYDFSGAGVDGVAVPGNGETYCMIQSGQVPLDLARGIGLGLARAVFGYKSTSENGTPEGRRGPCDGLNVFAPQRLIWIHYSAAGNSGECVDNGTSSMILNM